MLSNLNKDEKNLESKVLKILGDINVGTLFQTFFNMIFWIIYFALSFLISFLLSMLLEKRHLKFILFFVSFGILSAIWFRSPGASEIAPIISILFLENSKIDSQGIMRLIRPL